MYENALGANVFTNFGKAFKNLGNTALKPVTSVMRKPGTLLNVKKQLRMGMDIGKSAEKVAVSTNPLNHILETFDNKGIKAGGLGKWLGKLGEAARNKPIATTALVAAAVIGGSAAAAGSGSSSGTGATAAITAGEAGTATAGGGGLLSTLATASEAAGTAGTLVKTAEGLVHKNDEIDPYAADAELAKTDNSGLSNKFDMASMLTGQNIFLFLGLGALTVAGYMLFNKDEDKK